MFQLSGEATLITTKKRSVKCRQLLLVLFVSNLVISGCRSLDQQGTPWRVNVVDRFGQPIRNAMVTVWIASNVPLPNPSLDVSTTLTQLTDEYGYTTFFALRPVQIKAITFEAASYKARQTVGLVERVTLVEDVANAYLYLRDPAELSIDELRRVCVNVTSMESLAELALAMLPKKESVLAKLKEMCSDTFIRSYALTLLRVLGETNDWQTAAIWTSDPEAWLKSSKYQFFFYEPPTLMISRDEAFVDWTPTTPDGVRVMAIAASDIHSRAFGNDPTVAERSEEIVSRYRLALLKTFDSVTIERNSTDRGNTQKLYMLYARSKGGGSQKYLLKLQVTDRAWGVDGFWNVYSVTI